MKFEVTLEEYEKLKEALAEVFPNIEVELLVRDDALYNLGFTDKTPCIIDLKASEEQFDEIIEFAIDLEVEVYNVPDDRKIDKNDTSYIKFEKYGWLFSLSTWKRLD